MLATVWYRTMHQDSPPSMNPYHLRTTRILPPSGRCVHQRQPIKVLFDWAHRPVLSRSLDGIFHHWRQRDQWSLRPWLDQGLPHLAACFVELPIPPSFVGIILTLMAVLSGWMHGDRAPLDRSGKATRQLECGNSAGGARLAANQIIFILKFFLLCK